eukprot:TRINITY_DN12264_c0_g1_i1.p2 TRINITY_DN12264_c0_g1~~TRINITY_DN12264_c0_g1_i1.p2  ORF type:complete len:111 (-),score=2.81 TRINITY_DN12264_c0_g1_i1:1120-1452(-)
MLYGIDTKPASHGNKARCSQARSIRRCKNGLLSIHNLHGSTMVSCVRQQKVLRPRPPIVSTVMFGVCNFVSAGRENACSWIADSYLVRFGLVRILFRSSGVKRPQNGVHQ